MGDSGLRPSRNDKGGTMRITILFGGTNKERLVSVATAQALHAALPDADLWFWDADDTVHEVQSEGAARSMRGRSKMPFKPDGAASARSKQALDQAKAEDRAAGARPAWRQGGEWRTAGDVRNARHSLYRLRLGLVASRLRQGRGQALCGDRRRQGADRHRAGGHRGGACRTRQADRKAGARWIELRPDLRQCQAGPRRRPQRRQDRRISDRAVYFRHRSHLRRAGAVGWFGDLAAADRDHSGARARSTTPRNICRNRPRRFARAALRPRSARRSWIRRCGRTGRCRAAAIPAPTSSFRTRGRSIWKPIPCRA